MTKEECEIETSKAIMEMRKRIADLEKENAELKEKYVKNITDCDICDTYCNSQLTEAKEIIKELVRVEYADFTNGDYSNELSKVLEQAEQFLKETK